MPEQKFENTHLIGGRWEFPAGARFIRISPTKVRPVANLIRGKNINAAMDMLRFTRRRGSQFLTKILNTALANADYEIGNRNLDVDVDDLYVSEIMVDRGPMLKRGRAGTRGQYRPALRRMSHIRLTLRQGESARKEEAGGSPEPAAAQARGERKVRRARKAQEAAKKG